MSRCLAAAALVVVLGGPEPAVGAAKPPDLGALILEPRQVGPGYVLLPIARGRRVAGEATVDFCGADYPSEARRRERFQVQFVRSRGDVVLSNEVVRYNRGGAAQALRELERHVRTCPKTPVQGPVLGAPLEKYLVIKRLRDRRLLPGAIALEVTVDLVAGTRTLRVRGVVVYQRRGDVFSGVYALGGTAAARRSTALRAAAASADNLTRR